MNTSDVYIKKIDELQNNFKIKHDFFQSITTEFKNRTDLQKYKEAVIILRQDVNKSTIVNLYTLWESYVKKVISDTIYQCQNIFLDFSYLQKLLDKAHRKTYLAEKFFDSHNKSFIISKDIMTDSNNMTMTSFFNILKEINIIENGFERHAENGIKINPTSVKEVSLPEFQNQGPSPEIEVNSEIEIDTNTPIKNTWTDFYKLEINMLVNMRNKIAHIDTVENMWTVNQIIMMAETVKSLVITVDEFLKDEVLQKYLEADLDDELLPFVELEITNVFPRSNVVEVSPNQMFDHVKLAEKELLLFNRKKKFYRTVQVSSIKNSNQNTCQYLKKDQLFSVQLTGIDMWTLKQNEHLFMCQKNIAKTNSFTVNVTIDRNTL
ncbi:hypothetical protein BMS91_07320 [Leuconostoc mesenteroides subsp. cremoris]|nr:hypothetical protein BMS91_07320 [Leuconostoc mesenteroides subsp. cremoris]